LMSKLQAGVRGLASLDIAPEVLFARLNTLGARNIASHRVITFFYAQLDGAARRLHYVNAGHNAPIVVHRDGSHERLDVGGGVLDVFSLLTYAAGTRELDAGDRVVLFTDGVTEASDPENEEYGESRLLRLLEENRGGSAVGVQRKILTAAGEFCRGIWHDDATLIVIAVE